MDDILIVLLPLAFGAVVAALAALGLARRARARGRGDAPSGAPTRRASCSACRCPRWAALAIALGWGATLAAYGAYLFAYLRVEVAFDPDPFPWPLAPWVLGPGAAFAVAGVVGWLDDARPGGLRPLPKLAGQLVAGALLATPFLLSAEGGASAGEWALGLTAGALASAFACNVVNTFDNADGAAATVGGCGLFLGGFLGGPVVGIALLQLTVRRGPGRDAVVYLGDCGAHLVALALLVSPGGWGAFALPALDLARVTVERVRAGQRPWVGDRRHLAHRLQRRGLAPAPVAAVLLVVALPALLRPDALGLSGTAALFLACVLATREVAGPPPCPGENAPG
ncbi:MAG: hypothetical protein H6828_11105 [Planctomycetes bacterium]|nr:hypothetical protein [Planctomycetota bacterium]